MKVGINFVFILFQLVLRASPIKMSKSRLFTSRMGSDNYRSTCKNCHKTFCKDSIDQKCNFHPGIYSGRLNRINDIDTKDLEYFWSCCGEYQLESEGCTQAPHQSVCVDHLEILSC